MDNSEYDRRQVIKSLVFAAGGLISLPFWMTACRISDKNTHLSSFSVAEQETLAALVDAIIPASATPGEKPIGAILLGVDKYVQKMLDDCYEQPVQDNVKKQLAFLDESAHKLYGNGFAHSGVKGRQKVITMGLSSPDKDEKDFFTLIKEETIRGFSTSQRVMEEYQHYQVAPGHYDGCYPIINV